MTLNTHCVLVELILYKNVLFDLAIKMVDFLLLIFDSLLVFEVNLKDLLQLKLKEGVLLDIGVPNALVAVLVDYSQATVGELLGSTSIDLTLVIWHVRDGLMSDGVGKAALESRLGCWVKSLDMHGVQIRVVTLVASSDRALRDKSLKHLEEFLLVVL